MRGIKTTGLVRNPKNKNYVAENPLLEIQPILAFSGKLLINGSIVEQTIIPPPAQSQEAPKIIEKSRVGFTISEISSADMEVIQSHYDAIINKCKAIVKNNFTSVNPTIVYED